MEIRMSMMDAMNANINVKRIVKYVKEGIVLNAFLILN